MAATEGPVRVTEPKKARTVANETASDMEIDAQDNQPVGEDLYSRLKLCQRQQEFNEIQVRQLSTPELLMGLDLFHLPSASSAGKTSQNGSQKHQAKEIYSAQQERESSHL